MGCSASRPETLLWSANTASRSISHLVHHPPLKKGDTHHLVSLTSSTYGSLVQLNPNNSDSSSPAPCKEEDHASPSHTPHSVINTWELMADLDDDGDGDGDVQEFIPRKLNDKNNLRSLGTFQQDVPLENSKKKPLWQHLSEELILADMDPNVVSSFRKAESSRKLLGFSKSDKSFVSQAKVFKLSPLLDGDEIELPGTEDRIVIYFTSLRGIRRTYEDCCVVRMIFKGLRVPTDERDVSMDSEYRRELQCALGKVGKVEGGGLPRVFVRGKYLGGAEEVKQLHEDGELAKIVEGFPVQQHKSGLLCQNCGDVRFVPCLHCSGSRKVFDENEGRLRGCFKCNENGLIRCPNCCS